MVPELDANVLFVAFGVSIAITVVIALLRTLRIRKRAERILVAREAADVAAAKALGKGAWVRVRGKARATTDAPEARTSTPLTKRPVLWWRFTVRGETHRPGMLMWNNLAVETAARAFYVEDAAGGRMLVGVDAGAVGGLLVLVVSTNVDKTLCMDGEMLRADVKAFLSARPDLVEAVNTDGTAAVAVRTFEEVIAEGDDVEVIGVVDGEALVAGADGLIVTHGDAKEHAKTGRLWASGPDA